MPKAPAASTAPAVKAVPLASAPGPWVMSAGYRIAGYVATDAPNAVKPAGGSSLNGATAATGSGMASGANLGAPSASGLANVDIRAQVRARSQATVAAEVGGVLNLMLPEGRRFDKGQVLARLDCSLFTAQRDKSRVEVSAAQLQLKAQERLAQLEAGSQTDLALARNAVERLQSELKIVETQVSKCTITAPFNGVVGEHLQQNHQFVQPGQALMVVLDDGGYEIEFLAPSTWLRRITPGDEVFILVDELNLNIKAQVLRTGTRVDPVSQSIKVVAQLLNPPAKLKAGMSGRVAMATPTAP
ncbi:hypothetical protein B9Z51_10865 [Limnohabitans sp. T6-5]|nr:hypothetical protein B9Z51_10865 [Limnohabitans sp. T6-5]